MNLLLGRPACAAALAVFALAGCASFSEDGGFGEVDRLTRDRIGQAPSYQRTAEQTDAARARVAELLRQPLDADTAVQVALLNNADLQADYAELGIAEADLVRAGRLSNPSLGFGRLSGNGVVEIERAVIFDVWGLLTMPLARQVEQRRFEQTQLRAAGATVTVAAEARAAFFDAVAARQLLGYHTQVEAAAATSSELARRMLAAGNFSALAQMREQAFEFGTAIQLAHVRHRAVAARERLLRALGLAGESPELVLPDRLPDLPGAPAELRDAERAALDKRLDVLMARRDVDTTAKALGLSRVTRFVDVLHAGYRNKSTSGEPRSNGYDIELVLPLFDFGSTNVARAEAIYMQSMSRAAAVAVRARSEVRESYSGYRTAYEVAQRYRDEVVPLRKRISDENLLRYNGMLASAFDLLADSRDQMADVAGAVESLRDYWIAETQLQTALTGHAPGSR